MQAPKQPKPSRSSSREVRIRVPDFFRGCQKRGVSFFRVSLLDWNFKGKPKEAIAFLRASYSHLLGALDKKRTN